MMGRGALAGIALSLALAWPGGALAELTLYAAAKGVNEGSAPSTLYTLGVDDAIASPVGPIEGPDPGGPGTLQWENVTGLAFLPYDRLLGVASADAILDGALGSALIEIDRQSGAASFVGVIVDDNTGACGRITDLAFDTAGGVLYGIGRRCSDDEDRLYSIDPQTGEGSEIGVIDGNTRMGNGLAVEPASGDLFATRTQLVVGEDVPDRLLLQLRRLDKETGQAIFVNNSNTGTLGGLDFHPIDGVLYGVGLQEEVIDPDTIELVPALGTIDTSNARFTRIGVTTLDGEDLAGVEAIAFRAPGGCPPLASEGCFGPRKSKFAYRASGGKLKWKWARGTFGEESLGDPAADTDYRICVYDTAAPQPGAGASTPLLVTGGEAPAGERWKSTSKGFKYKSKDGAPEGIRSLKLKSGQSNAKLGVKGKDVAPAQLPFGQSPEVVVEVQNRAGSCWQGLYGEPAKKNDENRFEAKFK